MERWRSRWRAMPRFGRVGIGALGGSLVTLLYAVLWFEAYKQAMRPYSCDLGCVVFIPLYAGLALAGVVLGAWGAARPPRGARWGWVALAGAAAVGLLAPESLMAPVLLLDVLSAEVDWRTTFLVLAAAMAAQVVALFTLASALGGRLR